MVYLQLYNLIHSNTYGNLIQRLHKYFTFLSHMITNHGKMPIPHSDIIRQIMVNLASCTESLFGIRLIHIIHILFRENV